MMVIFAALALFWLISSLFHVASMGLVARRLSHGRRPLEVRRGGGLVSLVRPVCSIDPHIVAALTSGFVLDDPAYELIFCAHASDDQAVPVVQRLMADYPGVPAKLLVGDTISSGNPKLDNIAKSWPELAGEWVVFCDDNIVLPVNYLSQLFEVWGPNTGVVSSIHVGSEPADFGAEVECAFLNGYQARWHIFATVANHGFAHGKTMMLRRRDLADFGGIEGLGSEIAEDVAVTKFCRARGLAVNALRLPVVQPIGRRSGAEVFYRQSRWARVRRSCYPLAYVLELLSGGLFPIVAAGVLAHLMGVPVVYAVIGQALFWYVSELIFLAIAGWHLTWLTLPASIVRDMMIPVIWLSAWRNGSFKWRDRTMQTGLAAVGEASSPARVTR